MVFDLRQTVKAGALVKLEDRYVFMFGYNQNRDQLRVVRLGGHMEKGETPLQCAQREVREESGLDIKVMDAPFQYTHLEEAPETYLPCEISYADGPKPLYAYPLTRYSPEENGVVAIYLAKGKGTPTPQMETQGLLLLTLTQLSHLCVRPTTLADLRALGAEPILKQPLPEDMPLTPTSIVHFLNWLGKEGKLTSLEA